MIVWMIVTAVVGVAQVRTAVRHRNYKEVVAFAMLAIGAAVLALYVQQNPAQISLAKITLQLLRLN